VPEWLRSTGKTVDNLRCDLYACCCEDPMGSSEQWNDSVQNLLAIPYAREGGDLVTKCQFAYVKSKIWRMMLKQWRVSTKDHNDLLDTYNQLPKRMDYTVIWLDRARRGIRVSLCSGTDMKKAKDRESTSKNGWSGWKCNEKGG
jgi:hypothetical protein